MNKIKELIQDDKNFNKGTEFGNSLIEKSFRKFGAGRSILIDKNNRIIAGNKSVENAMSIGIEDVQIIESGYTPSNIKQGYVLRKILREIYKCGSTLDHEYFTDEIKRQEKILDKYNILKNKHVNKSKQWWLNGNLTKTTVT
jgi:hypothetical protein